jgi:hypothetical protein
MPLSQIIAGSIANNINIVTSGNVTTTGVTASGLIIASDFQSSVASFSWNSGTNTPAAVYSDTPIVLTNAHKNMRRCVLNANGTVNYYLDPFDSTKKADGTASVLTGADGNVMVEIPKFYTKRVVSGTITTWLLSDYPLDGYTVHPAFVKNGVEVNARYVGAYDACVNTTGSTYQSGLNADQNVGAGQNWNTATAKLASVSGIFPAVGITRAETRAMAANVGTGWRQLDFWLVQAIQYLYLTEYRTFYTQQQLGNGNTNVTAGYPASSDTQTDSPHSEAGKSNFLGNRSTNAVTGAVSGTRNTAYMSYRGIENWYGNCYDWVDGFNILDRQAYVTNTTPFDDTSTTTNGYTALGSTMPSSDNFVTNHQAIDNAWLPASVGGSSTTYWTDYYFQNTGARVARFGGFAISGASAGGFHWLLTDASSSRLRAFGGRLSF